MPADKKIAFLPTSGIDFSDIVSRIIKYVVEGGAVAVAAFVIPRRKMEIKEIVIIALTAAAVFAVLDLYAPAVGAGARQGAGFGVGSSLVGFGGITLPGGVKVPGIPPMP